MKSKSKKINVVMLVDAWFPSSDAGPGEFSGMQVHVRNLRQTLNKQLHCPVELFFPSNPNFLIRWSWIILVIGQVYRFSRDHQVDIIHSHGNLSAISAKLLSFILKKPVVHTVHRSSDLDMKRKTPQALFQWLTLTKIRFDAQITISNTFKTHSNINKNISVIPNGINLSAFNQVRVSKNIHPTLIWVGRDDPSKGLEVLRKAITRVRKNVPSLQTELVTGGRLVGTELIKAYKRSHVFVLPSLAETQPISLLEAWAAKLPVVVTNVGDNAHMVEDGINGILVEPNNVKQLSNAILKVLRAKVTNKRLGMAGYQYVKTHYSWNQVARRTCSVYQDAIQNKQS